MDGRHHDYLSISRVRYKMRVSNDGSSMKNSASFKKRQSDTASHKHTTHLDLSLHGPPRYDTTERDSQPEQVLCQTIEAAVQWSLPPAKDEFFYIFALRSSRRCRYKNRFGNGILLDALQTFHVSTTPKETSRFANVSFSRTKRTYAKNNLYFSFSFSYASTPSVLIFNPPSRTCKRLLEVEFKTCILDSISEELVQVQSNVINENFNCSNVFWC